MAESSIGPTNWMLRADSSQLGGDVDKAKKDMEKAMGGAKPFDLKASQKEFGGGLMRLNPILGELGFGVGKKTSKILGRELAGFMGEERFAKLAGGIGKVAATAGPAALGIYAAGKAFDWMLGMAAKADPTAAKNYATAWDSLNVSMGTLFVPFIKDVTGTVTNLAKLATVGDKGGIGNVFAKSMRHGTIGGILGTQVDLLTKAYEKAFGTISTKSFEPGKPQISSIGEFSDQLTAAAYGAEGVGATLQEKQLQKLDEISKKLDADDQKEKNKRGTKGG